jgi:hypothetical protein
VLPALVYTPEDVAEAVLHAAVRGGRDYYIGGSSKLMSSLNKHLPSLVDWLGTDYIIEQKVRDEPPHRDAAGALHDAGEDGQISRRFNALGQTKPLHKGDQTPDVDRCHNGRNRTRALTLLNPQQPSSDGRAQMNFVLVWEKGHPL